MPKSRKPHKKKTNKTNRPAIKSAVDKAVKKRDSFECAWCCTRLTDRHHIEEYAKGGADTVDNLILLCPNCHRQVHNGEIPHDELIKRKSIHAKGDRIEGGINFISNEPIFRLGNITLQNVVVLLLFNKKPLISVFKKNNEFFLNTSFYNKDGDLVFWMSSNRYWTPYNFAVTRSNKKLLIKNPKDSNNKLCFEQVNGTVKITGINYAGGNPIVIGEKMFRYEVKGVPPTTFSSIGITGMFFGISIFCNGKDATIRLG